MTRTLPAHDSIAAEGEAIASAGRRRRAVRQLVVLVILAGALAAAMLGRLWVGSEVGWPEQSAILALRADRLMVGLTVGVALAVAGALLQALLRNPLASPYVLGLSSGATLGVMLAWVGWLAALGPFRRHLAALIGALATMAVVYLLGQRRGRIDPIGLILVGVIVNALCSAGTMFVNYLTPHGQRGQMALWLLGDLNMDAGTSALLAVAAVTLAGLAMAIALGRAMDVATFGDAEAHALGVNLPRLRLVLFVVAGALTSGAVVLAGPIGFVGLISPHLVRLAAGPGHRVLLIGSALAGGSLVVGADVAVNLIDIGARHFMDQRLGLMPIGVITSLIGGPVFLLLLRPHLGRGLES